MPLTPIIRTKLHRPPTTRDVVGRTELYERLEENRHLPLTLVSAPAGYGKTTLVSHWLESHQGPSVWFSLEESDNDPLTFLGYWVAAVQTICPESCRETQVQLKAADPLPLQDLAAGLCNELDDCETKFVLVLDDYHRIHNSAIHDVLVGWLLEHMPPSVHLVIITRIDPPLPLGALRAHHMVNEIRLNDLEFTEREAGIFLKQATGRWISDSAVARVYEHVEGWPVGLRLTALALRQQQDPDAFLRDFDGDIQHIREYLFREVVSKQPPDVRDSMRSTSILDRFCAPLCEAIWRTEDPEAGQAFIQLLQDQGMLYVPLDEKREWYRYHHLFQELLYTELTTHATPNEIASLHQRAAGWFEEHGWLEEAMDHTLRGDGPAEAARLIVRRRSDIVNGEQWARLDLWLKRLPAAVVENEPELLMLQAWHFQNRGRYPQTYAVLDRIDEMVADGQCESCDIERLRGGVEALRARQRYDEGRGDLALEHIERALTLLPPDCLAERGYAFIHTGAALQMTGDLEQARARIYAALGDTSIPIGIFQTRLLMILSFLNWIAGDLLELQSTAMEMFRLAKEHDLPESASFGGYFQGIAQYQRNELTEAEASLAPVVVEQKASNLEFFCETAFALASVYQATGRADKAQETVDSLHERLLSARNPGLLQRARAYEADLALRQGRMSEASRWAEGFNPEPFRAMYQFYEPRMTLARVLIAQGSADTADNLLTRLETFVSRIHAPRFLIEVLALRALLHDTQGDEPAAREALGRAVSLGQPGGFIRLFVDLGPGLTRLLHSLALDEEGQGYVGRILAAFEPHRESQPGAPLIPSLTNREIEVLGLLADRLSRQDVADRLGISTATVKRHAENLYSKLGVPGRRQAVVKARELAILSSPRAAGS